MIHPGQQAQAKALDADTKGPLRDIHRRVGTVICFESSGDQTDKVAHLPELRFALGEPEVGTTSVDNAAVALEAKPYFIRKVGSDGFKIGHQPTMKQVVSDRRASLDEETEIKPAVRKLVEDEFRRGASVPVVLFPRDGAEGMRGLAAGQPATEFPERLAHAAARLLDPDTTLRGKIVEFIGRGDFGLASGQRPDGTYERAWFQEPVTADEVAFESGIFLLTKAKAQALKAGVPEPAPGPEPQAGPGPGPTPGVQTKTIRLVGAVPPEVWNRLGTKLLPKLRSGSDLKVGVDFSVTVNRDVAGSLTSDLRQILDDLGLANKVRLEEGGPTTVCS